MAELTIDIDDFEARLPRPFHDDHERRRAALLFQDAVAIIREAVEEAGYSPAEWVAVERNKRRAILVAHSMVATAIMIGENVGVMQVSTTTGPYTESTSYSGRIANPSLWRGVDRLAPTVFGVAVWINSTSVKPRPLPCLPGILPSEHVRRPFSRLRTNRGVVRAWLSRVWVSRSPLPRRVIWMTTGGGSKTPALSPPSTMVVYCPPPGHRTW